MVTQLEIGDYLTLLLYFVSVTGFGIWSSLKNRGSLQGYFLAGRSMHWIPVGASLFASNIGSGHFIGLAGSGASSGVGVANYEITSLFPLIFLGWIFLPVYIRSKVFTMPEYLKKRFGGDRIRITLTVFSLIAYIFTKISVDLFSGALFIKMSLDLNIYWSIGILIVISAFFTIGGGLSAVIWTDFIQSIIMIIGALYLMINSFVEIGGFPNMKLKYGYSIANTSLHSYSKCGIPQKDYFNLIRDVNSDIPWTGVTLGIQVLATWYFCTDQVIVQRVLAAKNLNHAKAGCLLAAVCKSLTLFLIVFPGMIARILYKNDVACADPEACRAFCGNPNGCSNVAYPKMVIDLMPVGARGLMLAVMMAALMSSLTSVFNSSSTIFTFDIYKRIRTSAKDWELLIVGRLFVVVLLVLSILSIPIIESSKDGRLFDYIQSIQSFMAPPICALFVMGIVVKRVNEVGSFYGLIVGFIIGSVRFIWLSFYDEATCGNPYDMNIKLAPSFINMHLLHFSIFSFILTCLLIWVISIFTRPIPERYIQGLTFSSKVKHEEANPMHTGKRKCDKNHLYATWQSSDHEDKEINLDAYRVEVLKKNEKIGCLKKSLFFICGIENKIDNEKRVCEENTLEFEKPNEYWSKICDISAISIVSLTGFILAFFNNFN